MLSLTPHWEVTSSLFAIDSDTEEIFAFNMLFQNSSSTEQTSSLLSPLQLIAIMVAELLLLQRLINLHNRKPAPPGWNV